MFNDLSRFEIPVFNELSRVLRMMDDTLGEFGFSDLRAAPRGTFPLINVGETEDAVSVYVFAPGVRNEDLDLSVQDGALIVRGKRTGGDGEANHENRTWYRQERFNGEFTRAVRLPDTVDPDHVEATLRNGVLTVTLRKREEMRPRRIEIKAA